VYKFYSDEYRFPEGGLSKKTTLPPSGEVVVDVQRPGIVSGKENALKGAPVFNLGEESKKPDWLDVVLNSPSNNPGFSVCVIFRSVI
jgi:hypothetical protein